MYLDDAPFTEPLETALPTPAPWGVLVVDDDQTVHLATALALEDVTIDGRPLRLMHAHSAAEAFSIIAAEPALAVVLLDVVMEGANAGLHLVRRIRGELGRRELRLVLRTGQPGYAPELTTVRDYDINDYWVKTDLTQLRLVVTLTTAVRAYAQMVELRLQRDAMAEMVQTLELARDAERHAARRQDEAERALVEARQTMELRISERTRELSDAIGELDAFNHRVAHDLRGPLYGLSGLSGLVRSRLAGDDLAPVRHWLVTMESQLRRLGELVDGLMQLSQPANAPLQLRRTELARLAAEAWQSLSLCADAPPFAGTLHADMLPTLQVEPTLMRQVFVNLLSNARKFCAEVPQPCVELRCERDGDGWLFHVRDNGVGFPSGQASQLFRPFTRLHGAHFAGNGIGLTIAQRIVQRHGGRIWAQGEVGRGATVSFSLPA